MKTVVKQESHLLFHRTDHIYYNFLPDGGGEVVKVVRTGKVGKRWQHTYELPVEDARQLWRRLKKQGYEGY